MRGMDKEQIRDLFNNLWNEKDPWPFSPNDVIIKKKKKILERYIKHSRTILDLGCGGGDFMNYVLEGGKGDRYIVGVDIAEGALVNAKKFNIYDKLVLGFIDEIDKFKDFYDLVLLNEVLYYQKDYLNALRKILSLCSKYIFISVAMGYLYFNNNDIKMIREVLKSEFFNIVVDTRIDYYRFRIIPLRLIIYRKYPQTHKHIFVGERYV